MSAEHVSEPTRRRDDDVLARLAAIDHRLHKISTRLAAIDQLVSQLAEIRTHLETLIGPLNSARPTVAGAAYEPADLELPRHPPTPAAGRLLERGCGCPVYLVLRAPPLCAAKEW